MATFERLTLHSKAARTILKSARVKADLYRRLQAIAAAAGPGMKATFPTETRQRARGIVVTDTDAARKAEARTRALTRALDAGRN